MDNPSQSSINHHSQKKASFILIVDDDESFSAMVKDLLEDFNYQAEIASDGPACLEYCRNSAPDLILLDIQMPGMNGFEVCRILKSEPQTNKIPIVLLSGLTDVDSKIRGFSLGVFDYVTKPLVHEELLARIESILGRQRMLEQDVEASKLDTVRQLSVTLADRINNPLAGILAACQILSKNIDDREKIIEIVEIITQSVDQIYSVLMQLTTADRVKSGDYTEGIPMIEVDDQSSAP